MENIMDNITRQYRKYQFNRVSTEYGEEFLPKIKVIKPNGETNWLNVSENELRQIINILTK